MDLFNALQTDDYEQVVFCQDKVSGLKGIIVIHDTTLGPALGGLRMWDYKTEEEALNDALRLAKGMTYKNAAAGLNIGGGKAVINGDPKKDKSQALFRAFGRYIERLGERYITAEDVGTTVQDMDHIHMETNNVTGTYNAGGVGDHSPLTSIGIYKKIALQGVGHVAYSLCSYLHEEKANIIVTDINAEAVERAVQAFGAESVEPDDIYDVDCDIFAPCALGGGINDDTISRLKAKVI